MKILITGGIGFIGYHLAKFHVERGDRIFIIDNLTKPTNEDDAGYNELKNNSSVELFQIDLTHKIDKINISGPIDYVYHLAAINGTELFYKIPYEVARTNMLVTINLLDWLEKIYVDRIIYTSTSEVYAGSEKYNLVQYPTKENVPVVFAQPTSSRFSYGASKFMGEFLFLHFGAKFDKKVTVLRYHNIYGPRMGNRHVIPELIMRLNMKENPLNLYGGQETRSFCYISDAISATYKIASEFNCSNEIIHVGNPMEEIQIIDLADKMINLMGLDIKVQSSSGLEGSVSRRCPDISKLQQLTNFEPLVDLYSGLQKTINWYLP